MPAETARRTEEANRQALRRMTAAQPALVDVMALQEFDPGLAGRVLTHAGPPVTPERMAGGMRGAVMAAALCEGWTKDPDEALRMLAAGEIELVSNHDRGGVGGVAGVLSPSMQVYVVEDRVSGKRTYCCHEYASLFGAYDDAALDELRRWNGDHMPAIGEAVRARGGVELKPIMRQALEMGDELHCRQTAASALLANRLAPDLARIGAVDTIELLAADDLTFLPLAMAASKCSLLAAEDIPGSSLVTVMARSGADFGIRVSGLGPLWFTAPAPQVESKFFDGFGPEDAGPDMGDSVITETGGLGAFALAASPAMVELIGGDPAGFVDISLQMRAITVGLHPDLVIPQLGYEGTATGVDVRKVVDTGVVPYVTTATSHREPGHRMIGLGISRPPMACFERAYQAWRERYEDN